MWLGTSGTEMFIADSEFNTSLFDHSFQILPPSPVGFIIINTALLLFKDVRHQLFEVGVQQKRRIKLPNTAFESTKTGKVKLKKKIMIRKTARKSFV